MELIRLSENEGKKVVNARDLHNFLVVEAKGGQVGEMFAHWIKRNLEYLNAKESVNYIVIEYDYLGNEIAKNSKPDNHKVSKREYALNIDLAKEISMIQNNDRGKQARQYFIDCERRLKETSTLPNFLDPAEAAIAWANEYKAKQLAEAKVKEMQPKADVYDNISKADNLIDMGKAAKTLGYGRTTLFSMLRGMKILMGNNTPYQKYIDLGYFDVKVKEVRKGDYIDAYTQTFVTGKGLTWLANEIKE